MTAGSDKTASVSLPGPREMFAYMQRQWLSNDPGPPGLLLDDQETRPDRGGRD
jgi:hypothetical protein